MDPTVINTDTTKRKGLTASYFRMKSKEVIHVNNLYKMMHEWFVEQEYCNENEYFPETYYRERRVSGVRRMYVLWRLRKEPENQPFYTRDMDVLIKCEHIKDVEVMQGGKKYKTNVGEVEIKCWSFMEVDARREWRKHWFLKHFLDIYWQRIFYRDFELHKQSVIRDTDEFRAAIKQFLNMMQYKE